MFSLVFYYLICPVPKHDTVLFLYFSFRHLVLGLIGLPQNPIYDLIKDNGKKLQVASVITISNIHVPVVGCIFGFASVSGSVSAYPDCKLHNAETGVGVL